MILKEIGFDMPYLPSSEVIQEISDRESISYDEASVLNYKLAWEEKRAFLNSETEALCAKVAARFPKIITDSFWKLMVECREEIDSDRVWDEVDGILSIDVLFDYERYRVCNNIAKINMQIEALTHAVEVAIDQGYISLCPILEITKEICGENFQHKWIWKKIRLKNGFTASIVMNHKLEAMEIGVLYENRKTGEQFERLLRKTDTSPFIYKDYLGKLIARGENEIELVSKDQSFGIRDRIRSD